MRVAAGFAELDEMLSELEAEPEDLQYAMAAYGLMVLLESRGEQARAAALRGKILRRDNGLTERVPPVFAARTSSGERLRAIARNFTPSAVFDLWNRICTPFSPSAFLRRKNASAPASPRS